MRLLITLTLLTVFSSCEKQREQVKKFIFDHRQISTKDIHRYKFDENGRIGIVHTTKFKYMAGVPFDSSTYMKRYEYTDNGRTVNIFDTKDSSRQTKVYNEIDSLIADYLINSDGDTIRLTVIDYINGKINKEIYRMLSMRFPEDFENMKREDLRNYDTLLFITKFIYEGDRHTKSLSFEKGELMTEETHFIYENGRKTKAITYSFLGDIKYIKETTIYSDNKSGDPDALTIGPQGDTIGFRKTIFQDQHKIVVNYMGQYNVQDISYYDNKGRHIGIVFLDLDKKVKTVQSYTYDDDGNVIEEASYKERINSEP